MGFEPREEGHGSNSSAPGVTSAITLVCIAIEALFEKRMRNLFRFHSAVTRDVIQWPVDIRHTTQFHGQGAWQAVSQWKR